MMSGFENDVFKKIFPVDGKNPLSGGGEGIESDVTDSDEDDGENEAYKAKPAGGPENVFQKSDIILTLDYSKSICFVLQQNGAKVFQSLSVLNNTLKEMKDVRIRLSSSPSFFEDLYFSLDGLSPGEEHYFNDINAALDFNYLSALCEKIKTDIVIETEINGAPVKKDVMKIDVLAFDEWPGYGTLPELLASFCTPQDPAVSMIISEASQLLKNDNLSFNGYQSSDPNVVNKQLAAIYSVIKSKNIAYCMPPASFEKQGQKIRLPQAVLNLGLGTCLDTTMLFCSCAESVGINPVVFIFSGHAFPAFWLTEKSFNECINDDISEVKKRMAGGLSQLCALESTLVTDKTTPYEGALKTAKTRIDDGSGFVLYLDISRARKAGILPLPVRYEVDGRYFVDRELYKASQQNVEPMRVIEVDTTGQASGDRLDKWKRDLLDITLKNPLISYRINKAGVPLLNYDLEAIEDAFSDGVQLNVAPQPKELSQPVSDITKLCVANDPNLAAILKTELSFKRLRSALNEEDLSKRLTALYRAAKLSVEENGASTLYIALGFLKWQEKDKPATDRYSPILLLPVEMVRRSASAGYYVSMTSDELIVNLSMIEMLRVNFKIDASALRVIPEGEKGIDVAKMLTLLRQLIIAQKGWDVIEASSLGLFQFSSFVLWNDLNLRESRLRTHPLTSSLITGKNDRRLYENADETHGQQRLYLPLDSDSSQTVAAKEAANGKTFILHGPPGTGKSQTITNIIGNALANGKRVLFVAEKIAALNVVKKRLDRLGLFDFCLELHSNKSQKKNFYEQFDKVLELAENAKDVHFQDAADKLAAAEKELDDFNTAMHTKKSAGCSVYSGINRLINAEQPEGELYTVGRTGVTEKQYDDGLDALKSLTDIGAALGEPVNSAFYGAEVTQFSFGLKDEVSEVSKEICAAHTQFTAAMQGIEALLKGKKSKYDFNLYETIKDVHFCLSEILYYNAKSGFIRFLASVFSKRFATLRKMPYFKKLNGYVKKNRPEAELLFNGIDAFVKPEKRLRDALKYGSRYEKTSNWAFEIYNAASAFSQGISSLKDYCIYNANREKCAAFPQLTEITADYHNGKVESVDAAPLFIKSFWQSWLIDNVSADPVLRGFSPTEFRTKRERFNAFTQFVSELTQKEIYLKMAKNLPNFQYAAMSSSEPGLLLKAVKSRGRGITIRQIFERIPALMSKVKPCMLMSPLSAAQYLPENYPEFDLVVFDEASQLLTCDAVGAIARGRNAVVVGDPNQLPPTTFFMKRTEESEDDFESQDLESILDDMLTLNVPQEKLLWHYRSEHESLIAFSNSNYYDNRLITFPSPDDLRSRVIFRKVDGVYERGTTRTNPKEAEAVLDELFRCLKDPELSKLSYGIVTFNINQQNLLEDMIDKRLAKEPMLERFFSGTEDPVFVKNIESVQGDERDVIMFSVTYGADKEGKMTVNFGPVNKDGGWRRLNVAITRACKKIILFSTITPDMIDLSRTSSKGVKGLKEFMSYAINCRTYNKKAQDGATDTAFVCSVADALKSKGYNVSVNMGRSSNKIDIAITDDNGVYTLGIICDNEKTALSTNVRDREYGRESVLKRMGWKLARVYALEWWQNPEAELKKLVDILEQKESAADGVTEAVKLVEELKENHTEISFNPAIPLPVCEYAVTDLPVDSQESFYLYNSSAAIIAQINKIIETEAPVSESMLYKKIAAAWSISRMTQKYNEYMAQLIKRINPVTTTTQNVKFYWRKKEDFAMSRYRDNSVVERKAEDICKEEYAVAAYYIMKNALSISLDDLIRETAKLFGFIKTPAASMRINYAVSQLLVEGKITKDGEICKLK